MTKKYFIVKNTVIFGILTSALIMTSGCSIFKADHTNKNTETQIESQSNKEQESTSDETQGSPVSATAQEDFYTYINQEWINGTKIPADKPSVTEFSEADDKIRELLKADFGKMLKEENRPEGELGSLLDFYEMSLDFEKRNKDGIEPILADLKKIDEIKDMDDFRTRLTELTMEGYTLPFPALVMADMEDTSKNMMYLTAPDLTFGDKSMYDAENPVSAQLLPVYEQVCTQLLVLTGETEENAAKMAKEAVEYETLLASYVRSAEEKSIIANMYNPTDIADISKKVNNIDLSEYLLGLVGEVPEKVNLVEPNFYENLDKLINDENFSKMKNWIKIQHLMYYDTSLSEEVRQVSAPIAMMMTGQAEMISPEDSAFNGATFLFSQVSGEYYGKTYFGEEAKKDLEHIISDIVNVYKERINEKNWLSEETKAKAIYKLDHINVKAGYPENIPALYSKMQITPYEQGGNLYENRKQITKLMIKDNYEKLSQEVNKGEWVLSADTVNAMYSPTENSIFITAAIAQAPYYDKERSYSENLGGIGAIIGHEITHAFDSNGSLYDENGNLNNWWTEEDQKAFQEKCDLMVAKFDGVKVEAGEVSGALTVTENVADAGGISSAFAVANQLPDADLEGFFKTYAMIWREKSTPQYQAMVLTMDVHAPNPLRTNLQVNNIDEFYEIFNIKEGDQMYIAPQDRLTIW